MASITKTEKGWRAFLCVDGKRESANFRTQREANAWAGARETELRAYAGRNPGEKITLRQVLERYRQEVTPHKRGARWEKLRIEHFLRSAALPLERTLAEVTPEHIAAWRDDRLRAVKPGTLLREMGLLGGVFTHARREWRLVTTNPVHDVRRPPAPDHREAVYSWSQIKAMLRALDHHPGKAPRQKRHAVALAFLAALRTGARAGELCGLTWDRVHAAHFATTHKNGRTAASIRHVPLTPKARRLLERLKGYHPINVFGLSSANLDALFRKYRQQAGLTGFTFHDSRHTAATRLAPKVDALTLCKIFGWSNPKMAMVYYNPTASDIARRLAA